MRTRNETLAVDMELSQMALREQFRESEQRRTRPWKPEKEEENKNQRTRQCCPVVSAGVCS